MTTDTPPPVPPVKACVTESMRDSLIITAAFMVIIWTVQSRHPNPEKLLRFVLVFVPVLAFLKHEHTALAKTLVNGAGFALATQLFTLLTEA